MTPKRLLSLEKGYNRFLAPKSDNFFSEKQEMLSARLLN
jgi:hypothetical protein